MARCEIASARGRMSWRRVVRTALVLRRSGDRTCGDVAIVATQASARLVVAFDRARVPPLAMVARARRPRDRGRTVQSASRTAAGKPFRGGAAADGGMRLGSQASGLDADARGTQTAAAIGRLRSSAMAVARRPETPEARVDAPASSRREVAALNGYGARSRSSTSPIVARARARRGRSSARLATVSESTQPARSWDRSVPQSALRLSAGCWR